MRFAEGLPAGAVAAAACATTGAAAAHLGKAIAAINRLVAAWLERHTGLAATVRANRCVHLSRCAFAAISAGHRRFACIAALRTTGWRVCQPFAGVKLLLANRENEITAAVAAPECLIGGQNLYPLSGPAAPLAPGPKRPHTNGGTTRYWGNAVEKPRVSSRKEADACQATASVR